MTSEQGRTHILGQACCVAAPIAFGLFAIVLGQDANWDLRNYHWYNAFAFLTGRFGLDLAPATFYNPLLDVPLFLLAQHVPARVCGFVLGAVQGLNFVLLYGLARALLPRWSQWGRGAGAAIVAAFGLVGGGSLGLVGTTFYDNVVSLFVLGALLVVVRSSGTGATQPPLKAFVVGGLLVGAAAGLKLPAAIYAIGLAAACFCWPGPIRERLRHTIGFGVAAAVGVLAFGGFWMLRLWSSFGNPIFPYFNDVFGSSMALDASYRDARFIPTSLFDAAAFPFLFSFDSYRVGEIEFTDFRVLALFVIAIGTVTFALVRRSRDPTQWPPALVFVLAASTVSYLVWLGLFAIYRYIVTLEMLAPLLVVTLISTWPVSERGRIVTVVLLGALVLIGTRPGTWGRTDWSERFVEVTAPTVVDTRATMVLMVGFVPSSWVIPAFPPDVAFVRLQGYSHHPDDGDVGLARVARTRVSSHDGAFYLLYARGERQLARQIIDRFDLATDFASCEPVRGNLDSALRFCPVRRKVVQP